MDSPLEKLKNLEARLSEPDSLLAAVSFGADSAFLPKAAHGAPGPDRGTRNVHSGAASLCCPEGT